MNGRQRRRAESQQVCSSPSPCSLIGTVSRDMYELRSELYPGCSLSEPIPAVYSHICVCLNSVGFSYFLPFLYIYPSPFPNSSQQKLQFVTTTIPSRDPGSFISQKVQHLGFENPPIPTSLTTPKLSTVTGKWTPSLPRSRAGPQNRSSPSVYTQNSLVVLGTDL